MDLKITNMPAKFWNTTHVNIKKNRKKAHNKIPKKFQWKKKND